MFVLRGENFILKRDFCEELIFFERDFYQEKNVKYEISFFLGENILVGKGTATKGGESLIRKREFY